MRIKTSLAALVLAAAAFSPASAVVVQTAPFLTSITNFNGFESIGNGFSSNTIYSDGGIDVAYIGTATLWNTYLFEGNSGWYPSGGGTGYTSISLTSGAAFSGIQFLAGSGYGDSGYTMSYELRLAGAVIATGVAGEVGGTLRTYGFLGSFDEVRVQNRSAPGFDANGYEALAIDSIAIAGVAGMGAVPEPESWMLMVVGFGLVGAATRRRVRHVAY